MAVDLTRVNYILLKSDGSVLTQKLDYYIQQGSTGVDKIFFGSLSAENTDVGQAICTLPNGQQNTLVGSYDTCTYKINGVDTTIGGFLFTLTTDQTNYNGGLIMALAIYRYSNRLVNYPLYLVINETGLQSDTDTGVTVEEINSYLQQVQGMLRIDNGILVVDSMTYQLAAEREVGQIFFSRDTGLFYIKNSENYPFYEQLSSETDCLPYVSDEEPEDVNTVWIDTSEEEEEEPLRRVVEDNYSLSNSAPIIENNFGSDNVVVEDNYGREN